MLPAEYHIQAFSFELFPLMKELFHSAFGISVDSDAFHKKYDTAGLGLPVIGFLAIHTATETPAAYYGVFPVKIIMDGKEILAAQSGDTMTHPEHQKKGLFVALAKIAYAEARSKGVRLIFGQPNKNSYRGLMKLGWMHADDIVSYDLKLSLKTFPLAKVSIRTKLFDSYLKYAGWVLGENSISDLMDFTNSCLSNQGKIVRNKAYLEYKNAKDKKFIRIDDVVLWIKFTDVLWIGDASDYKKISEGTIGKLKALAMRLGYNTIRFHINKNLKPSFLNYFTRREEEASCFYYLDESCRNKTLTLTGADFDTW
jgi:GNAT superfamily N-acetyltransferase